ncbi:MAG: 16S rRNA (adenine(1518)-N(6)/adenine(1519)-N(6))-dimethyltransferase RsmA [Breznakibacter sp.]
MKHVRAKKHLGQHFLNDLSIAQRITDSLASGLPVLEVGPGMGVLTQFLVQRPGIDLKLIEIDTESVDYLLQHFPGLGSKIIYGDFLRLDLKETMGTPFALIGNFPYNISSQIFFKVLDYRDMIPEVVGMLQKEVAERLASKPGGKEYGILSVLLQAYYDIEYLFTVHENVFTPPPKVKSAVIRITRNQRHDLGCDPKVFKQVVKATFNQRRKAIRNSLKLIDFNRDAVMGHPLVNLRPEQLTVEQFVELTLLVENNPSKPVVK